MSQDQSFDGVNSLFERSIKPSNMAFQGFYARSNQQPDQNN